MKILPCQHFFRQAAQKIRAKCIFLKKILSCYDFFSVLTTWPDLIISNVQSTNFSQKIRLVLLSSNYGKNESKRLEIVSRQEILTNEKTLLVKNSNNIFYSLESLVSIYQKLFLGFHRISWFGANNFPVILDHDFYYCCCFHFQTFENSCKDSAPSCQAIFILHWSKFEGIPKIRLENFLRQWSI